MGKIIWLASYPKSGNTWLRIFLSNLLGEKDQPININKELVDSPMASNRRIFEQLVGVDSSILTPEEIRNLLPGVHLARSRSYETPQFVKVHDAYLYNSDGIPVFPNEATHKVIYLLRNPLDVCCSFAHFHGKVTIEETIAIMNNPEYHFSLSKSGYSSQLPQKACTWSQHVRSWQHGMPEKTLMVRYEDMKYTPLATFSKIVHFLELPYDQEAIKKAISFSSFDQLQQQEKEHVFSENMNLGKPFFRKGKTGSWKEELNQEQVDLIVEHHRAVMMEFGYLDAEGRPY